MKFIEPDQIVLPRVYFTEFDRVSYTQREMDRNELQELCLNLERKMKLLSLTKGHIVIAASHFIESELAQDFIMKNPLLLEKEVILPALDSKHGAFGELLQTKRDSMADGTRESRVEAELYLDNRESVQQGYPLPSDVAQYLDERTTSVVTWEASKASDYFRKKLIADLNDESSILRFGLGSEEVAQRDIDTLVKEIESIEGWSRNHVYFAAAKSSSEAIRDWVPEYADFIYYLAGALAVNSEGTLPQENLIDFSIADLASRRTRLSEYEIFWRIFVGIVESKTNKHFPTDVLDALTFDEIVDMRKNLLSRSFIEKYNGLIAVTKAGIDISDPEHLVLNLRELLEYEMELQEMFAQCIEAEIYKQKVMRSAASGGKVLANVAAVVSCYGVVASIFNLVVNVMSYFGLAEYKGNFERKLRSELRDLSLFVDTSPSLNKPIFLEFLNQVVEEYKLKLI